MPYISNLITQVLEAGGMYLLYFAALSPYIAETLSKLIGLSNPWPIKKAERIKFILAA